MMNHMHFTCIYVLHFYIYIYLYTGWWFGIFYLFFHSVGNFIIPTDDSSYCFRGVGQPATSTL